MYISRSETGMSATQETDGTGLVIVYTMFCILHEKLLPRLYISHKQCKTLYNLYITNAKHGISRDMRFPIMWYVRPAKAQTCLRIRAD